MNRTKLGASLAAIFSAILYGVSVPFVKLYGPDSSPSLTSALLYFGAACAMVVVAIILKTTRQSDALGGKPLTGKQVPTLALMVVLNTSSAILLIAGIALCSSATASLLGNLEVAATALLAWLIFREPITKRLAVAILLITVAGALLSWTGEGLDLSLGALLIVAACVFWGLENNCTRALSAHNVVHVTAIKGFFTGVISWLAAVALGEPLIAQGALQLLIVGMASYGLSIALYIWSQRHIGAARTGNYYSIAPFVGVAASWLVFGFEVSFAFVAALVLSIVGTILTGIDVSKAPSESLRPD